MWSLVVLLLSVGCEPGQTGSTMCDIKSVKGLEKQAQCKYLRMYTDDEKIMEHPRLFDKIKTVTTIFKLKFFNTTLTSLTETEVVMLPQKATLELLDNPLLQKLPEFNIVDGRKINIKVLNNPKLDTTQLLEQCKKKRCPTNTIANIQKPYTCTFHRPLPEGCRFVFDSVDLRTYDSSFDQIEVVYGALSLRDSNEKEFPLLPNLRQLSQKPGMPVLVIENNKNLTDLKALYTININVDDMNNAMRIKDNPKLCIEHHDANEPFVVKFLTKIDSCSKAGFI
ncbi:unnamed protein product [Cylicocyclus nassatus]|uniref:Receptor L-domain domain-containing protein n=1 Tax=Cylicocyclus nassatus TaxID=53992 RepID=A0AA36HC93_CYLNA|nr:unnamed protein product [Cylicocyclus nassatus]